MLNYLRAEFFRLFHRKYLYVLTGILVILSFLVVLILRSASPAQTMEMIFGILIMVLPMVLYLFIFFADITGNEEYKAQTYKNVLSFGLSREKIYLCKLIETIAISVLSLIIVLGVFVGAGALLSGVTMSDGAREASGLFWTRLYASIPLYLGSISVAVMFSMLLRNAVAFVAAYIAFMGVTGSVFQLLSIKFPVFETMRQFLIPTQFEAMQFDTYGLPEIQHGIVVGLAFFVAAAVLGMLAFHKKEAK